MDSVWLEEVVYIKLQFYKHLHKCTCIYSAFSYIWNPYKFTAKISFFCFWTISVMEGGVEIPRKLDPFFRKRDWYGDHAEAGKIWEDQLFAIEAGLCRPKCTQMDESICQGFRNSWRNWFSLIFQVVAAGFLKVIFQFEEFNEECAKQDCPYT